ncbi:cation:proton antiporter [Roseateles noduli]|uniref:cation:proton antiporter n=1 Tax=Roseateles noduli TaxID=2052484 RepID=UPI003D648470
MENLEVTLALLAISLLVLHLARQFRLPYPSVLAIAGCVVAAVPFLPVLSIEAQLALALFIAPAVLDSATEISPRELRHNWLPLLSLAVLLVIATSLAVAWTAVSYAGLALPAALALGAIVAPPDAAAATAVLRQFNLPRRTIVVLQGESLFNDAIALLIFGLAIAMWASPETLFTRSLPQLLVAVPAGIALGGVAAIVNIQASRRLKGTLSSVVLKVTITYGTWVAAEHLHLSAIASMVGLAMVTAKYLPKHLSARDRVQAEAVWVSFVFVLNVLAFLLMGLQARSIVTGLDNATLWKSLTFSGVILLVVLVTRAVWVFAYGTMLRSLRGVLADKAPLVFVPNKRTGVLVMWCGMRGLVTLASALALPEAFPSRDLIVLSAFVVVVGTLVIQGLTIRPLIGALSLLRGPAGGDMAEVRAKLLREALSTLERSESPAAAHLREEYEQVRSKLLQGLLPADERSEFDQLRAEVLHSQRLLLRRLRSEDQIDDETFRCIAQDLDWAEIAAQPREQTQIADA